MPTTAPKPTVRSHTPLRIALAAFALVALLTSSACKDRKKPLRDVKTGRGPTLATLGAYAPLLRSTERGSERASTAIVIARARVSDALQASVDAAHGHITADELDSNHVLWLDVELSLLANACAVPPNSAATATCAEQLNKFERGHLKDLHDDAVAASLASDFPEKIEQWASAESTADAAPLIQLERMKFDDLGKVWADASASKEALEAQCASTTQALGKVVEATRIQQAARPQSTNTIWPTLMRSLLTLNAGDGCRQLQHLDSLQVMSENCTAGKIKHCFDNSICSDVRQMADLSSVPKAYQARVAQWAASCRSEK
jgi:hypothetical protein